MAAAGIGEAPADDAGISSGITQGPVAGKAQAGVVAVPSSAVAAYGVVEAVGGYDGGDGIVDVVLAECDGGFAGRVVGDDLVVPGCAVARTSELLSV